MHHITVSDIDIEVDRKDIKNLHLSVYPPDGRVRIATPLKIDDEAVRLFAISKLAWIKKQKLKFENQPRETKRKYITGESHNLMGHQYRLNVIHHSGAPEIVIRNMDFIDFYVRAKTGIKQREKVFNNWYREHLKELVPPLIQKWETKTGIKINDWNIRKMKTKWGTCNEDDKRILINLELAKKPEKCLEYIILHEILHIKERKHTEKFTQLLDKYMPKWRSYKRQLNAFILHHSEW